MSLSSYSSFRESIYQKFFTLSFQLYLLLKIYCIPCSKEKTSEDFPVPAINRYQSSIIKDIYQLAKTDKVEFRILSGKYGLLDPDKKIDWYDKKLQFEDLPEYKMLVLEQLKTLKVVEVVLFSKDQDKFPEWAPYGSAMKETCSILRIKFQERIFE